MAKHQPKNIIFQWCPDDSRQDKISKGIPDEYAIEKNDEADSGIVVWARTGEEWHANPFTLRPLIAHLLSFDPCSGRSCDECEIGGCDHGREVV